MAYNYNGVEYSNLLDKLRAQRNDLKEKIKSITNEIESGRFYDSVLDKKVMFQKRFIYHLEKIKLLIRDEKVKLKKYINKQQRIAAEQNRDVEIKLFETRNKITQRKALKGKIQEYNVNGSNEHIENFNNIFIGYYDSIKLITEEDPDKKEQEKQQIKSEAITEMIEELFNMPYNN